MEGETTNARCAFVGKARPECGLALQTSKLCERRVDLRECALVQFAETHHAFRINNEQRMVSKTGLFVKDTQLAANSTVWPEVGQQWMVDATHGYAPGLE